MAATVVGLPGPAGMRAHPLHTTITTIAFDTVSHQATVTIRIFTSDLDTAVARRSHAHVTPNVPLADSASFAYLGSAFTAVGRDGRPLTLRWCGSRTTGDLLWACLRLTVPLGLSGVRIRNQALVELFDDQVNVVMADYGGRRESLLFTKGDVAKALP